MDWQGARDSGHGLVRRQRRRRWERGSQISRKSVNKGRGRDGKGIKEAMSRRKQIRKNSVGEAYLEVRVEPQK